MPKGLAFWIVYLIALVFVLWVGWPWGWSAMPVFVVFFLVGLLGWAVFGRPIQ